MNQKQARGAVCLSLLVLMFNSGCEKSSDKSIPKKNESSLAGNIVIEGSSTVEPIAIRAKEKFNREHSKVGVSVSGKGTGNGFVALFKGEADIASASRPITSVEFGKACDAKIAFFEIPVAYDGLTFVVNKSNDFVKQLTMEQLAKIFCEDKAVKTWNEVDPSWPKEPITLYVPGIASGTHHYFVEMMASKTQSKGVRSDERVTLSEDDKLLVRGVKEDKYAIGFFGFAYYMAERESLQAVKIVDENGTGVEPTDETIFSGAYPFSRPLFFYVSADSYKRMEVKEFVDRSLSEAAAIAKDAGFIPLKEELYSQSFDRLEADAKGLGTHFLNASGEAREGSLTEIFQVENLVQKLSDNDRK